MISWQRNLFFIMVAQFFSIMAFSFALPFAPFYLQEMGVRDPHRLKIWIALFNSSAAFSLAVFAPLWGTISDRYGRRLMLLRSYFGGLVILLLMGLASSPTMLVGLRFFQGALTGTVTAAITMVSVHTPENRSGYALGMLSASVSSGNFCGSFLGGLFADLFGYRQAFFAASGLLLVAALLVLFGTEEYVSRRRDENDAEPQKLRLAPGHLGAAGLILVMMFMSGFVLSFDHSWLPLLVQEIHGGLRGVSFWAGSLGAASGVAGLLAGPIIGRLADRLTPPLIARFSALGAGGMALLIAVASNFPFLFASRFCMAFCAGGLEPVFQIWLSKVTPQQERGFVFGWASTARALGWMLSPLVSGFVAWLAGIRAVFFATAFLLFLLVPLITFVVYRLRRYPEPAV